MWSNSRTVPGDSGDSLSSDEGSSSDEHPGVSDQSDGEGLARTPTKIRSRPTYQNIVRLSRKWVRKVIVSSQDTAPRYVALATSPCGCMFAVACASDVVLWLRRRNLKTQGKPWDKVKEGRNRAKHEHLISGEAGESRPGSWDYQPATVLAHDEKIAQVAWGRGPGNQQDYLLTLEEGGR